MKRFCLPIILCSALVALIVAGITSTHAAGISNCSLTYTVRWGDTLSGIASQHRETWQGIQQINELANPNFIFPGEQLCLARRNVTATAIKGTGNYFSYPQCTWGANQKYHALHGIWVPWTTNSNAYQWADRARDFHWTVSAAPQVGDIFVLAPHQQGAYGLGHVGVVTQVKGKTFIGTSTNWFPRFYSFTDVEYTTTGVQFLRY